MAVTIVCVLLRFGGVVMRSVYRFVPYGSRTVRGAPRFRDGAIDSREPGHFARTKWTPSLCTRSQRHSLLSTGRSWYVWPPAAPLIPQEHRGNWPNTPTGDP
ncbi:hypothetical protein GCM10010274_56010 [Streptomyces lavendofoliae]|uniref:Uncharacterized protein n=1 Tax=Streptomyces lavendofoliae TaxID=67314 RepID=A0A918M7L6_9ACTN|nr:hypothetical protein GCM10010274_56010 [Streptomyces lavendofoliae]